MKKQKILITGSNGLVGQKVLHQLLLNQNVEVIATSRGENRVSKRDGYQYQSLDVTHPKDTSRTLQQLKPDAIIHTAAMTDVNACEKNQRECWAANVKAVENLIRACSKIGTRIVHISTDFVFDGEKGPYREEDATHPVNYYGQSKLESENLFKQCKTPWAVLRTILLYGVAEKMSHSNIVLWAIKSLQSPDPMRVVEDQFRAPTLAEDLATACITAALEEARGIYHISGEELMSIKELVLQVAKVFELDASKIQIVLSKQLQEIAKRPARTGFILDKAKRDLRYCPHSFEEGLRLVRSQLADHSPSFS